MTAWLPQRQEEKTRFTTDSAQQSDMKKRILVIDDDPDIRDLLAARIESLGFDVLTAASGWEGLDLLKRFPCAGIFLDIEMPEMNGLTMLRILHEYGFDPPVIMMSTPENRDRLNQAMEAGATGYLIKPFDQTTLTQTCATVFQ